jgi:ethanolamine utilization protein EutN
VRIGKVIGNLTLSRWHPTLTGGCYRIVVPLSLENLANNTPADAEPIVVYDDRGAGVDSMIAFSEGGEAAQPFYPAHKPVDAYNAALLDDIQIHTKTAPTSG